MATQAESRRKRVAPYVPASTMSAFFDHIRYVRTPTEVDSGLLQDYGISSGHVFALLSTLKFLGLVNDKGTPLPIFQELQTGGDEFKDTLRGVLERAYTDLFSRLDVSRDTKDKIVNFFARNYSPATAERAARLFLDLCGEAGIETVSQPRKADAVRERIKTQGGQKKQQDVVQQQEPQELRNAARSTRDDDPVQPTAPRIDVRINSQDFVNMDADQIKAVFEGLSKVWPQAVDRKVNGGT